MMKKTILFAAILASSATHAALPDDFDVTKLKQTHTVTAAAEVVNGLELMAYIGANTLTTNVQYNERAFWAGLKAHDSVQEAYLGLKSYNVKSSIDPVTQVITIAATGDQTGKTLKVKPITNQTWSYATAQNNELIYMHNGELTGISQTIDIVSPIFQNVEPGSYELNATAYIYTH